MNHAHISVCLIVTSRDQLVLQLDRYDFNFYWKETFSGILKYMYCVKMMPRYSRLRVIREVVSRFQNIIGIYAR